MSMTVQSASVVIIGCGNEDDDVKMRLASGGFTISGRPPPLSVGNICAGWNARWQPVPSGSNVCK